MEKYFNYYYTGGDFKIMSLSHILALLVIIIINVLLLMWTKKSGKKNLEISIRYTLATLLILQEISLNIWRLYYNKWEVGTSLPLHLCGVAIILAAILMVNKNFKLYEIVYFWGLGGAIQALIQPDIGIFSYPHFRFFQFFVSHGLLITAALYATFIFGYKPRFKSVFKIFGITNLYMVAMALFNYLFDGNYLFICHPPETASIIDLLGPWPWYIIPLEIIALVSFLIYYSPVWLYQMMLRYKK